MCERCHKEPGYIVHHKVWLTPKNIHDPSISLSFANLEYVCKACHDAIHGFGQDESGKRSVMFDANGDPIAPPFGGSDAGDRGTGAGVTLKRRPKSRRGVNK